MPLKSFAVSKYTQLVKKNTGGLFFLSLNISGSVMQEIYQDVLKLTARLAAVFKSISMTSIYFKYIMCCCFCCHHMLYYRKKVTLSIDTNKVSMPWTLIIFWIISQYL